MTRLLSATLIVVTIAGASIVAQDRGVYRAGVDAVTLDVSVLRGNAPVAGLTASDFEILDNGVRQKVQTLDAAALPIDVTFAVDTSGSMFGTMAGISKDIDVLSGLLRATDRVRLITLSDTVIRVFDFQPVGAALPKPTLEASGATSLHDGLAAAVMQEPDVDRRHLVIVFTDGVDTVSALSSDAVVELSKRINSVVRVFLMTPLPGDVPGITGARAPTPPQPTPQPALSMLNTRRYWAPISIGGMSSTMDDVAANTGGHVDPLFLDAADAVPRSLARAIEEFRASYVLRYTATGVPKTGWHDVVVKVTKPGRFDVRARKGYFAK